MAFYKNKYGELTSTYGLVGDDEVSATDSLKAQEARDQASLTAGTAIKDQAARKSIAATQADAQIESARLQADAMVRAARERAGYKNGGPVIKGEYKHANPTYAKFSKSGDSSLLAKGRK